MRFEKFRGAQHSPCSVADMLGMKSNTHGAAVFAQPVPFRTIILAPHSIGNPEAAGAKDTGSASILLDLVRGRRMPRSQMFGDGIVELENLSFSS
ncbi:hypothetical protein GWG65_28100 [Bradyrhizobium sp. CSA207]|uniref:hypothetical protein n=1 Tax=Bradyrhizobium sp. CSA207 TaxID=2698826 RepID=UPI0023AF6966|nr:hypothetical protein [Bradyrhizobium sp. CSA207]MDE5445234.1 hypothetical protein [Bradyrhizobium sp. CSA207]